MGGLGRGLRLAGASLRVIAADKTLLVFPLVGALLSILVTVLFGGILVASGGPARWEQEQYGAIEGVVGFAYYLVVSFVVIFCNSALVAAADLRLRGGDATVAAGFGAAMARLPQIFVWSLVSATVGIILSAVRDRGGMVGRIVAAIGGAAWGLVTFFVIPILVLEGVGPVAAFKGSGSLLRRTWGEQVAGNAGIGLVFGLLSVLVLLVGGGLAAALFNASQSVAILLIGVTIALLVVLALIGSTLSGVFKVAVYRYATSGSAGAYFDAETVSSAFVPSRR